MGLLFYIIIGSNVITEKSYKILFGNINNIGNIKYFVNPAPNWTIWATFQIFRGN